MRLRAYSYEILDSENTPYRIDVWGELLDRVHVFLYRGGRAIDSLILERSDGLDSTFMIGKNFLNINYRIRIGMGQVLRHTAIIGPSRDKLYCSLGFESFYREGVSGVLNADGDSLVPMDEHSLYLVTSTIEDRRKASASVPEYECTIVESLDVQSRDHPESEQRFSATSILEYDSERAAFFNGTTTLSGLYDVFVKRENPDTTFSLEHETVRCVLLNRRQYILFGGKWYQREGHTLFLQ
jgi:hypothetical protein